MREILFRGKRPDDGEWIYGDLSQETLCYRSEVVPNFGITGRDACSASYKVSPETVGEYTGMTDKNDTKIFENDIVEYTDDVGNWTCYTVVYVAMYGGWCAMSRDRELEAMDYRFAKNCRIVGNVYDLQGAQKND